MSTTESLKSFNEETKEEKLAAAKQKLKQFKKVSKQTNNHMNKQDENNLRNDLYNNNNNNSGRSSPASSKSSSFIINNQQQFQNISLDYRDQQLQLHVQTIGILVAEKAELHSKLQQTLKKCDKKQDECDELAGRLKVSRQKIIDLEKLVQQLNNNNNNNYNQINHHEQQNKVNHDHEMITSNENILVEELKMKLNETNDRLTSKQQEIINLNQLNTDLSSQIELLNMKLTQFSNSLSISNETNELEEKLVSLQVKTQTQQATINDYEFKLKQQHDSLKQEYQQYVDQLKHQIENLVDQINRLTDERETSFDKIDKLKDLLDRSNKQKESLELKLIELEDKLKQTEDKLNSSIQLQPQTNNNNSNKEQLLENEIKYFKQQIEILIKDHNNFVNLLDEKEHIIRTLQTQLPDKEAQKRLLEQMHNDKQTLSRAIQQNKELKDQLAELQDAFVSLTKQNAQLTNQLDSEKFKLKQTESVVATAAAAAVTSVSSEWDDDSDNQENKQQNSETTLMNVIKDRLNELEKENKDLNDYITLMDENLKRTNDQQLSTINSQLNEINSLNDTIKILNNNNNKNEKLIQFDNNNNNQENLILLEDKFKKTMNENAELKEKNQELEHVISQLQFETETIVDYITMYQLEREKLNKKYELKDEAIRSLSTQLQVNKLALNELKNYFGAYTTTTSLNDPESESKRIFILNQAQYLLNELTLRSTTTLQTLSSTLKNNNLKQIDSNKLGSQQQQSLQHQKIDNNSIQAFKSVVTVCPSCQGDLFVV